MPNTLKALLLIPLALLASCATGPKLTPEMEALRLSLNQRMANTSSTSKEASVGGSQDGQFFDTLRTGNTTVKTQILRNGDLEIKRDVSFTAEVFLERSGIKTRKSITTFGTRTVSRLPSRSLPFMHVSLTNKSAFAKSSSFDTADSQGKTLFRSRDDNFSCDVLLWGGHEFQLISHKNDPPRPKIPGVDMFILEKTSQTIATSPDKAFIQGIVRDMNRFIELYKALPK